MIKDWHPSLRVVNERLFTLRHPLLYNRPQYRQTQCREHSEGQFLSVDGYCPVGIPHGHRPINLAQLNPRGRII